MRIKNIIKAIMIICMYANVSANQDNATLLYAMSPSVDGKFPIETPHHFIFEDGMPQNIKCELGCYQDDPEIGSCAINCFEEKTPETVTGAGWFSFFKNGSSTICRNVENTYAKMYQYVSNTDRFYVAQKDSLEPPSYLRKCKY